MFFCQKDGFNRALPNGVSVLASSRSVRIRDRGVLRWYTLCVHYNPDFEDIGFLRAQEDWSWHVAPVKDYKGGFGIEYSLMTEAVQNVYRTDWN